MTRPSKRVLPLQLVETSRISVLTMADVIRGRLSRTKCTRLLGEWGQRAFHLADAELVTHGLENYDSGQTYLLMSNHQSMFDIFALFVAFPGHLRMVAKKEMFVLPVMQQAMHAADFVRIDRGDHMKARAALDHANEVISGGVNVWIAPEGTRSQSGTMLPFKKGGFMLALQTGIKILPVSVVGTRDILPSKDWRVRKGGRVDIHFHAPVDPTVYGLERRDELIADVRARIESALPGYEP